MSKITITINTENAAFDDDEFRVVAEIMNDLARQFHDNYSLLSVDSYRIRDINGNTVGKVQIQDS